MILSKVHFNPRVISTNCSRSMVSMWIGHCAIVGFSMLPHIFHRLGWQGGRPLHQLPLRFAHLQWLKATPRLAKIRRLRPPGCQDDAVRICRVDPWRDLYKSAERHNIERRCGLTMFNQQNWLVWFQILVGYYGFNQPKWKYRPIIGTVYLPKNL